MEMKKFFIVLFSFLSCVSLLKGEENNAVIIEYLPAPGQFVNILPAVGSNPADATVKAQQNIDRGSMISLGGFGGFVKAKFGTRVMRVENQPELLILGNAHSNGAEPGIVWVSYDANENGIADDEWYQLVGSEDDNSTKSYSITYYKPSAADDESTNAIDNYIMWKNNLNETGWIPKNTIHNQSYYPEWITADSITYIGTLLPDNAVDVNGDGSYYSLVPYDWGYVDNYPNSEQSKNLFDIDNAVDAEGNKVTLPGVDFVMIQSAINGIHGAIGESSTEVSAIKEAVPTYTFVDDATVIYCYVVDKEVFLSEPLPSEAYIYTADGKCVSIVKVGAFTINLIDFSRGLYIIRSKNLLFKVVI